MSFFFGLQVLLVLLLVVLVLLQNPKSDGLSGLSSGSGVGNNQSFTPSTRASGIVYTTAVVAFLFIANSITIGVLQAKKYHIMDRIPVQHEKTEALNIPFND